MISHELLLLKLIEVRGSLSLLRERGFSNSQIALMMENQEAMGNITIDERGVQLTEDGYNELKAGFSELKYKPKEVWILPRETAYREPISLWHVVLPPKI